MHRNRIRMYARAFIVFFLSFSQFHPAFSQTQDFYDSLNVARQLMEELKISQAISILRSCEKAYPDNVHVIRLHGQALYWSKDFEATRNYFRASIERNPHLEILKLDYGRILFELNQLNESKIILNEYLKAEPENAETHIMLGKIAYWQGRRPKKSLQHLSAVHKYYPSNQETVDLIKEVRQNTSPYLTISSSRYRDSQPLEAIQTIAEAGFYQSAWLQPSIQLENRLFSEDLNAQHFQFTNKTAFPKSKTAVLMRAGVFRNSWTNETPHTAGIKIRQQLSNDYELAGGIDRSPYLSTLRSLNSNALQTNYSASIGRETGTKFKGKVMFQHQQFEDNNFVQWFSLWILFPIASTPAFQFDIGYAFLAAGSKENRFVLENPDDANLSPTAPGNTYPGVFDPYFTPQKQIVNSFLAKIELKLGSAVRISFNNNIGVFARIDNPEFVEGGTGGSRPGNPVFPPSTTQPRGIYKVFTPTRYFPLDLKSTISWSLSKKILFTGEYNYFKTIWFDSHTFSAGLKMNFWNDKRTY
jgi:tetratricopeptide (TPR) repeat protein